MKETSENDEISKINRQDFNSSQYISCIESATKRAPVSWTTSESIPSLELINSDILGKFKISSLRNVTYFLVFLDDSDSTEMSAVNFLKEKS